RFAQVRPAQFRPAQVRPAQAHLARYSVQHGRPERLVLAAMQQLAPAGSDLDSRAHAATFTRGVSPVSRISRFALRYWRGDRPDAFRSCRGCSGRWTDPSAYMT